MEADSRIDDLEGHRSNAPVTIDEESTGVTPELLDRLRPYLRESLMVLDHDWTIKANLAPPGGLIGRGLGLGLHTLEDMHPDDAIMIMDLGIQAFSTQHGWQGSKIVRMRTGAETYGRYEITAINCFDDPVIAGMVVRTRELPAEMTEDVTGIERSSTIETLAELLPLGVLLLDNRGAIIFANETVCGMLGREPEALKRDGLAPSIAEGDQPIVADMIRRTTEAPGREVCTIDLVGAISERVECRFNSDGAADVTCLVVTLEDVTERDRSRRMLERRANHDALTGLRNRASLGDLLAARLDAGLSTTIAYIDLDGFKAVNDTYGHERGDNLLVALADALLSDMSPSAVVSRLGGDEFVVVMHGLDATLTKALGHLIQATVTDVGHSEHVEISCSVGLAHDRAGDTPGDLLRRADEAMYAAKAARRS